MHIDSSIVKFQGRETIFLYKSKDILEFTDYGVLVTK
jgi:hypothetical protein